jgi:hypothetical protein
MSHRIVCYTLFDITATGVLNRQRPVEDHEYNVWVHKRNTQCNFDTILQSISLRSQPEIVKHPEKLLVTFDDNSDFGFLFDGEDQPCWTFEFDIMHASVFDDGINELGALYNDCDGVPMIKCGTEWDKLPAFLDTSPEMRNIYFKVVTNEAQN